MATSLPISRGNTSVADRVRAAIDFHYDALWRFLRRLGIPEDQVEDAVQQVLLVFARKASGIAADADRAFLFGTALRIASDMRRKGLRRPEIVGEHALLMQPHPAPDPERRMADQELLQCLDRVLDQLGAEHRVVFVLAELEEMTMAQIGEILSIPLGTVASRLRRARELFEAGASALKAQLVGGIR